MDYMFSFLKNRRSHANLRDKEEEAGKKVTWEPRTQAPVEWEIAPTSTTRATRVRLPRQPQPLLPPSPSPSTPSTLSTSSSGTRTDRPDNGRIDSVKFPVSFEPDPFGALEPSTTVETRLHPSIFLNCRQYRRSVILCWIYREESTNCNNTCKM